MMNRNVVLLLAAGIASATSFAGLSPEEFRSPPPAARPHTWWHWMNGNVTKEGITADLEAMARVGIGGAQMFDAGLALPKGPRFAFRRVYGVPPTFYRRQPPSPART